MKCANILCFFYSFFQRVGYILHTLGQKRTGCWLYFTHSWLYFTTNYTYTILTITILNGKKTNDLSFLAISIRNTILNYNGNYEIV